MRTLFVSLFLLVALFAKSQVVTNVRSEQDGNKINILYNIEKSKDGQTFKIGVACLTDGRRFVLKSVKGDVGDNIRGGYNKKIVWDVLKDVAELNAAEFFVTIEKINEPNSTNESAPVTNNEPSEKKSYFAVSVGTSVPTGDFKSTNENSDKSGYANTGADFNLSMALMFTPNFGIAGMLGGIANTRTIKISRFGSVNIASDPWSAGFMMGGLQLGIPSGKSMFGLRAMGGFASANSPKTSINDGFSFYEQEAKTASAFSFDIGALVKINLSERICLLGNVDYFSTTPKFTGVITFDGTTIDFEQKITVVTVTLGVGFNF